VGTIFLDTPSRPGSPFSILELTIPYVAGGRLLWETPLDSLRIGGSVQALRLDTTLLSNMDPTPITAEISAVLWVASAEYAAEDLLVAAEYGRWHAQTESDNPMVIPEGTTVSERGYGLVSYRVTPWLQPGAYYSLLYPDVDQRTGRDAKQHDAAVTLRFDVNLHWLVKLEGHYLYGTAALSPRINDGLGRDELARHWGLFLVKTTAHF
jgi:hypothetical protein